MLSRLFGVTEYVKQVTPFESRQPVNTSSAPKIVDGSKDADDTLGIASQEVSNMEERYYVADARYDVNEAAMRVGRAEAELAAAEAAHGDAIHALDAANARADDEHQAWREQIA
jgi:hypothetical protein